MAHVITVNCIKGGVSKTTSTLTIGSILASRGQRVLLIDIDAQNNLTRALSGEEFPEYIYDAFERKAKTGRNELRTYNVRENLDLVPSNDETGNIDTAFLSIPDIQFYLCDLVDSVRDNYDWVLIDTSPFRGITVTNSLVACDRVIVPMDLDKFSVEGLNKTMTLIGQIRRMNPSLDILGILISKFHPRVKVDRNIVALLQDSDYGKYLFESKISYTTAFNASQFLGGDICSSTPSNRAAADYLALVDEIQDRIK